MTLVHLSHYTVCIAARETRNLLKPEPFLGQRYQGYKSPLVPPFNPRQGKSFQGNMSNYQGYHNYGFQPGHFRNKAQPKGRKFKSGGNYLSPDL